MESSPVNDNGDEGEMECGREQPLPRTRPLPNITTLHLIFFQQNFTPNQNQASQTMHNSNWGPHKPPKIDFPKFDDCDLRGWVMCCDQYYDFKPMEEEVRKTKFASIHFEGKARLWYQFYQFERGIIPWMMFINDVIVRFGATDHLDVQAEFNKLSQTSTVEAYQDEFEELRVMIVTKQRGLTEEYFISSFISGL